MPSGDAGESPVEGESEGREESQRRAQLISAIDHPLRRRILRLLLDEDVPLSPVQMAETLTALLGSVAYHVRVLRRLGAVEPVGERRVRGAIQRFSRTTIENDPPIEKLLEETREADEAAGGVGQDG